MKDDDYREVPATIAPALALWAASVAAGTLAGVFVRLHAGAYAMLVAFSIAFAAGVVMTDARVRGWLDARGSQVAWLALCAWATTLAAAGIGLAVDAGAGRASAAPWAPILLFGVPVSAALAIAALRHLRRAPGGALRPPASTAPGRRPASPSGSRTSAALAAAARARAAG